MVFAIQTIICLRSFTEIFNTVIKTVIVNVVNDLREVSVMPTKNNPMQ